MRRESRRWSSYRSARPSPIQRRLRARWADRGTPERRAGRSEEPVRPDRRREASQIRGSRVGRGDDLDVETVEQGAWAELRIGHTSSDLVVDGIGRLGAWDQIDPEYLNELMFQPVARRRAPKEFPVLAERMPDLPRVGLGRTPIGPRHPELSRFDALRCQHPEHIVIGNDQQLRRVGERGIVGEHLRFHVPVHTDQRQILGLAIDLPGNAALLCRKWQSPVRIEREGTHRERSTPSSRSAILTGRPVRNDSLPAMPTAIARIPASQSAGRSNQSSPGPRKISASSSASPPP